jgi:hypothetical protein
MMEAMVVPKSEEGKDYEEGRGRAEGEEKSYEKDQQDCGDGKRREGERGKEEALKAEALEFYRQLRERGFTPFNGASIDFHRKRNPVVFIPRENPVIATVKKEELLKFFMANDVRRVLVDALFPSRVPILQSLLEHGIEVYILRRPSALAGFKAMMLRRLRRNKRDEDLDDNEKKLTKLLQKKNDFIDAVALAFTWPKFHRKVDIPYLICWRAMNNWRRSYMLYYKVQQMLGEDEDESPVVTLHEDRLIEKARDFVDTVEMHYPKMRQVFEEVGIPDDDAIAQALCYEIVLETYHIEKVSDVSKKAGISVLPIPKRRKKRKEPKGEEAKENESNSQPKKFFHDGKLLSAVVQLTIKLYHLDPRRKQTKDHVESPETTEKDLEIFKKAPDDGRGRPGGGSLVGVRALSKREGCDV